MELQTNYALYSKNYPKKHKKPIPVVDIKNSLLSGKIPVERINKLLSSALLLYSKSVHQTGGTPLKRGKFNLSSQSYSERRSPVGD